MASLNIIGCGRAAGSLAALWRRQGVFEIGTVVNRSVESSRAAVARIGAGYPGLDTSSMAAADFLMIGTPDSEISGVAQSLGGGEFDSRQTTIFHLSGALSSAVLRQAGLVLAPVASCHPLYSFATDQDISDDAGGSWCGFEGELPAVTALKPVFEAIGFQSFDIDTESKLAYHAAGVMASNYLNGLLHTVIETYRQAGIEPSLGSRICLPLVGNTLQNIAKMGVAEALTGPIARGDVATVSSEAEILDRLEPKLGAVYRTMGRATLDLAEAGEMLNKKQLEALRRALNP